MAIKKVYLTQEGARVSAFCQNNSIKVKFLSMGFGSGENYNPSQATKMTDEKCVVPIHSCKRIESNHYKVRSEFSNDILESDLVLREICLYCEDPEKTGEKVMYCYGNAKTDDYDYTETIPAFTTSGNVSTRIFDIDTYVQGDNATYYIEHTGKADIATVQELREDLEQEITDRTDQDNTLLEKINKEISDRQTGDTNAKNLANATGVLAIEHGGTGTSTSAGARHNVMYEMNEVEEDLTDSSYVVGFYNNPDRSNGAVYKRKGSTVWNYIKKKIESISLNFLSSLKIRVTSSSDVSLTSFDTDPLTIGKKDGLNMGIDDNEIQARNNGEASSLNLNPNGGDIKFGTKSFTISADGGEYSGQSATAKASISSQVRVAVYDETKPYALLASFKDYATSNNDINFVFLAVKETVSGARTGKNFYVMNINSRWSKDAFSWLKWECLYSTTGENPDLTLTYKYTADTDMQFEIRGAFNGSYQQWRIIPVINSSGDYGSDALSVHKWTYRNVRGTGSEICVTSPTENLPNIAEMTKPTSPVIHGKADGLTKTLTVAEGGTGATTAKAGQYQLLNNINEVTGTVSEDMYFAGCYISPNTSTGVIYKRKGSTVWSWIQSKIASVLGLTSSTYKGKASTAGTADTATKATQDGSGNNIVNTYAKKTDVSSQYHDKSTLNTKVFGAPNSNEVAKYVEISSLETFGGIEVNVAYSGKWLFTTPLDKPLYISANGSTYNNYGLTGWAWSEDGFKLYLRLKGFRGISVSALGAITSRVKINDWTTTEPSGVTWRTDEYDVIKELNGKLGKTEVASSSNKINVADTNYTGGLNDCEVGKLYNVNTVANSKNTPMTNGWATVFTLNYNGNDKYKHQVCIYNNNSYIYKRWSADGVWHPWERIATLSDITTHSHPTTSGNKHIPSGGASSQVLGYSADGTAQWAGRHDFIYTCSTANTTTAKTVALTGFKLEVGACIRVRFTNGNNVASPTLNVNNTGAKEIRALRRGMNIVPLTLQYGGRSHGAFWWQGNTILELMYDGTYWLVLNNPVVNSAIDDSYMTSTSESYSDNVSFRYYLDGYKEQWGFVKKSSAVDSTGLWQPKINFNKSFYDRMSFNVNLNLSLDDNNGAITRATLVYNTNTTASAIDVRVSNYSAESSVKPIIAWNAQGY